MASSCSGLNGTPSSSTRSDGPNARELVEVEAELGHGSTSRPSSEPGRPGGTSRSGTTRPDGRGRSRPARARRRSCSDSSTQVTPSPIGPCACTSGVVALAQPQHDELGAGARSGGAPGESGALADVVRERVEGAVAHRHLVDPELRVRGQVVAAHLGLGGLEVGDVHRAVGVDLDAVERAAQVDAVLADGHVDLEAVLARDEGALGPRGVPGEEAAQRLGGRDPLGARLPHGLEPELGPHRVDVLLERLEVGRQHLARDVVGDDVHERAETQRGGAGDVGLGLVAEEPAQGAGGDLAELAAGERERLVARDAPAPVTRSGRAGPTSGRGRRRARAGDRRRRRRRRAPPAGGRLPRAARPGAKRSTATQRSWATRPGTDSGLAGRPATWSATGSGSRAERRRRGSGRAAGRRRAPSAPP